MKNNYVKLNGNIANEVKVFKTSNGKSMCRVTIVTEGDKGFKEFVRCVAWGNVADKVGKNSKGDAIKIEGYIHNSSFESNGEKRFSTDVVIDEVL